MGIESYTLLGIQCTSLGHASAAFIYSLQKGI